MTTSAPIEAGADQRPASRCQGADVKAKLGECLSSGIGDLDVVAIAPEQAVRFECLEEKDTDVSGQMVVAHARDAQRRLAGTGPEADGPRPVGDAHEVLEEIRHVTVGEAEIPVSSLSLDRNESRVRQPGEMCAHRLLCHEGNNREFGGCQSPISQKGRQDIGAGLVTDQCTDECDIGAVAHGSMVNEQFSER